MSEQNVQEEEKVSVKQLKAALTNKNEQYIETVRGIGFRLWRI